MKRQILNDFIRRVEEKLKYAKPEDKFHVEKGGVGCLGAIGSNGVFIDNEFIQEIEDLTDDENFHFIHGMLKTDPNTRLFLTDRSQFHTVDRSQMLIPLIWRISHNSVIKQGYKYEKVSN